MNRSYRSITFESPQWETLCRGFAQAAHGRHLPPRAVLLCDSPKALQEAFLHALEEGVPFCLRSGGHSYEGQSSNAPNGYIIDTSGIKTRKRIGINRFRLGAGLTQIELVRYLQKYGFAVPYATGGTVGLAGLVLGGGVGFASRTWGTVAHHVQRLHCVMADGSLRWIDAKSPEVRAIMSAGGGSMVALAEVEMRAHWKPFIPVFFLRWETGDALKVLLAIDSEGPSSDRRLGFVLRLGTDGTVALFGQCNSGGYFTARSLLAKLLRKAPPPVERKIFWMPHSFASNLFFRVTKEQHDGWHAKIGRQLFKSSSALTSQPLDQEVAEKMCNILAQHPTLKNVPEEVSMVQLLVGGGAMWDENHAHIPHHKSRILYQLDGYWLDDADKDAVLKWVAELRSALETASVGNYVNYIDDSILEGQRSRKYYGEAYDQILAVKKQLDPKNIFTHTHSPHP